MTQPQNETNEVFQGVGDTLRGLVFVGMEIAVLMATRRAERAAQARAESDAAARRYAERLRAERAAAMPIMRQTWGRRWWRDATPERIRDAWQVTESWARNGDPYARVTLQHMREEIADRYNVDLPEVLPEGTDLADLVGAGSEQARREAEQTVTGEEITERETTYRYKISAREGDHRGVEDVVHVPYDDGRAPELLAADLLLAYKQDTRNTGEHDISLYAADGTHLCDVNGDQAGHVRDAALERRGRILRGEETASPEELRDALYAERRRLAESIRTDDPRYAAAREQLDIERRARGLPPLETTRPDGQEQVSPAEAAERVADAREQLGQVHIRLQAVDAELRGEDPGQVFQAYALRSSLDEDWWQTASSEEVTAVYGDVQQWSDGAAKDAMLADLQADISRHYGAEIDHRATPEDVENAVYQGKAERSGRRVINYSIDAPLTTGERGEVMAWRTTAPDGEDPRDTARRILTDEIGDLQRARDQQLRVNLTDHADNTIASLSAAEVADPAAQRDADRLRERAREEDTSAVRADQTAEVLDRRDEQLLADAEDDHARDLRAAAEQDRDAAASLEAVDDPEGVESVTVAGRDRTQPPGQQLRQGLRRGRGDRRLRRPPRTRGHQPEPER